MSDVLVEQRKHVLVMTLNRPEARNAINEGIAEELAAALDRLDGDPDLRIGVLTGAGGTFSAGMDLKGFLRGENPVIEGRGLAGITEAPPRTPLIAAVEGWALAGGCGIVLACDLVVAGRGAQFGIPGGKRGRGARGGGVPPAP